MVVTILLVIGTLLCIIGLFVFLGFGDNYLLFEIGLVMLCLSVSVFIGLAMCVIGSYYSGGGL